MSNITFESLFTRIETITKSERVTKHELGLLSREALTYVLESEDVRPVNMLLGKGEDGKFILTHNNRAVAGMYFVEFLPFTSEDRDGVKVFIKKKAKVFDKYVAKINDWLGDGANDIWTWAEANVEMEVKPKNYAGKISKLVEKALGDEAEGITKADVLLSVMQAGISVDDLMAIVETLAKPAEEKAA